MNVYFESNPQGLWMGIIVALIVQALCLWIITLCTNWENEVMYFDVKSYIIYQFHLMAHFFCFVGEESC